MHQSQLLEQTTQITKHHSKMSDKLISQEILDWANDDLGETKEETIQSAQLGLFLSEPKDLEHPDIDSSQIVRIKYMFASNRNKPICHNEFIESYMPRFGGLIHSLRHDERWVIDKEWCEVEEHNHKSHQYAYIFRGVRD